VKVRVLLIRFFFVVIVEIMYNAAPTDKDERMSFPSPEINDSIRWGIIERSLVAQARAHKLCEEAERIRESSRNLRAESRRLRSGSRKLKDEAADAVNNAERLASASAA